VFQNESVVQGQKHAGAAAETEARHPVTPKEPPKHWGRTQLVGLAVFIGVPVLLYILLERL
jgi:hypothetical protein